jgi:hypothetical protein
LTVDDLARLQRDTFKYFAEEVNLENGLVRDSTRRGSASSSEAMILYVLGLASPTFPLPTESYKAWTMTYKWKKLYKPMRSVIRRSLRVMVALAGALRRVMVLDRQNNASTVVACASSWISKGYYGLDQGPIIMMIENYRTGFIWRLMQRCPFIVSGLRRAGFRGGWLEDPP